MKTQRRHELQTNVLADWLGKQIESIQPYWQLIAGVLVGGVLIALVIYFISLPRPGDSGPWTALFSALGRPNAELELRKVAVNNPGSPAASWAKLAGADLKLEEGLRLLYGDKDQAARVLNEALADYQEVTKTASVAMVRHRAIWATAKTYEAMAATRADDSDLAKNQASDLKKAAEQYRLLVKDGVDSEGNATAIGREAKRSLDRLVDSKGDLQPSIAMLYMQLAMYKPPERTADVFDETDLKRVPDLSFPGEEPLALDPPATEPPATEPPVVAPPPGEPPAITPPSTTPPAASDPGGEKKPEGVPATPGEVPSTEKPSTEEPTTEKPATQAPPANSDAAEKPAPAASGAEPKADVESPELSTSP